MVPTGMLPLLMAVAFIENLITADSPGASQGKLHFSPVATNAQLLGSKRFGFVDATTLSTIAESGSKVAVEPGAGNTSIISTLVA